MANFIARGKRIHVANQLIRLADIAPDNAYQRFVHLTTLRELHNRNVKTFLVHAGSICPEPSPANIDYVRGTGKEAHQLFFSE